MSGAAGRGNVRDHGATASRWPQWPCDEGEVVAERAVVGGESDAAARRRRGPTTKKPSAPHHTRALLSQRPPSRSTSPASCSASGTCIEWTIEGMMTMVMGPCAGPHTPAARGWDTIGAGRTSADEDGWATEHTTTCTLARSHHPASWPSSSSGSAPVTVTSQATATTIMHVTCSTVVRSKGAAPSGPAGQVT